MKTSNKSISASPIAENQPQLRQQAIELIYEGEEVNALGILQSANNSLIQLAELDERLAGITSSTFSHGLISEC